MLELRDQLKCIVFSTHIMSEAERLCDRIAIVYRGRILAEGTLRQLQEKYAEKDLEELFFRLISAEEEAGAGVGGLGAGSREQRAGSSEQGAGVGSAK